MRRASILILLILVACTGTTLPGQSSEKKFYEGHDGVTLRFAPDSPPKTVYISDQEQEFYVDIFVRNHGSSLSRGGIYLSGYDSALIDIIDVDEGRGFFDSCTMGLGGIGISKEAGVSSQEGFQYGKYNTLFQCRRFGLSVANLGQSLSDLGLIFDLKDIGLGFFEHSRYNPLGSFFDSTNIRFQLGPQGKRLDINFDDPDFDPKLGIRGRFFLSLWAPYDFTLNDGKEFLLPGDIPEFPGETEEVISYRGVVKPLPPGFEKVKHPIMATSCFLYTTFAAPEVCIDPDPFSGTEKVCSAGKHSYPNGQGAPVAITSVKQKSTGKEILFFIDVENVGGGKIYSPFAVDKCVPYNPEPASFWDLDVVLIGNIYIGNEQNRLPCLPFNNMIKLQNGKGSTGCLFKFQEGRAYSKSGFKTPLVMELWYGYAKSIKTQIEMVQTTRSPFPQDRSGT